MKCLIKSYEIWFYDDNVYQVRENQKNVLYVKIMKYHNVLYDFKQINRKFSVIYINKTCGIHPNKNFQEINYKYGFLVF